jgi:hypothetical protein
MVVALGFEVAPPVPTNGKFGWVMMHSSALADPAIKANAETLNAAAKAERLAVLRKVLMRIPLR